ncbi:hypothetical protein GALL_476120 [mine drainage metagenome]|uniref:Uncharacterized protein n=1 Tax=mine drainage metagenome TaxID=410659 RepID=A0A1J5PH48_9ZZZZ
MAVGDELRQLALAREHIGEIEAGEFVLVRTRAGHQAEPHQVIEQPVVERPLVLELQGAQAVGNALQRILDGMGEGVHRVDAPVAAGAMVMGKPNAVDRRIAQIDVRRRHVDFRAQHHAAFRVLPVTHLLEAMQVVGGRAVAPRTVHPRLGERATVAAHVVGVLLIHVSQTVFDQRAGATVHEVEVVAGIIQMRDPVGFPVESQPAHRVQNGIDVFLVFLFRVGVVEAQVADATIVLRQTEVQADALGMADMQITVRLGRKAGADARRVGLPLGVPGGIRRMPGKTAPGMGALRQVALDDLAQEVRRFVSVFHSSAI